VYKGHISNIENIDILHMSPPSIMRVTAGANERLAREGCIGQESSTSGNVAPCGRSKKMLINAHLVGLWKARLVRRHSSGSSPLQPFSRELCNPLKKQKGSDLNKQQFNNQAFTACTDPSALALVFHHTDTHT
jgi:hypothetical protein